MIPLRSPSIPFDVQRECAEWPRGPQIRETILWLRLLTEINGRALETGRSTPTHPPPCGADSKMNCREWQEATHDSGAGPRSL